MSGFSDQMANMSEKKRELLRMLLAEKQQSRGGALVPQPRQAGVNVFPVSFEQRRLWAGQQLNPVDVTYNLCFAIGLVGPLDTLALEQCLRVLVQRHEALRTTFDLRAGEVVQVIAPHLEVPLAQTDLRGAEQREAEIERLAARDAQQPFDLRVGPLIRIHLLRLADQEHTLLLNIHHIISDTWSMGLLLHDIQRVYAATISGAVARLPELPIQYADYAAWQRQYLQGPALEEQMRYWRAELAGLPELLALPTDAPRPPAQTFRGDTYTFALDVPTSAAITALAQAEGVTLFVVLISAFQMLLAYLSGQNVICVGTALANRTQVETEAVVGYFANTLVLHTRLAGDPSLHEIFAGVQQHVFGAQAHQSMPFDRLVQELCPTRNPQYHPLFQVAFVLQNVPRSSPELPGLKMLLLKVNTGHVPFDLLVHMTPLGASFTGSIDYNADLFHQQRIAHMALLFTALLEHMARQPAATLQELYRHLTEVDAAERRKRQADVTKTRSAQLRSIRRRAEEPDA